MIVTTDVINTLSGYCFMQIELYLIKLENRKKENRITWDYIVQYTKNNVKVTSLLKIYKTVPREKIIAQV